MSRARLWVDECSLMCTELSAIREMSQARGVSVTRMVAFLADCGARCVEVRGQTFVGGAGGERGWLEGVGSRDGARVLRVCWGGFDG